ncbi:MAG TPA: VWA domain-containing protein [Terriglobia bacterium]|nr:VWA domain-containing protein [Terriglobia bacterium]HVQ63265.1 VWA domain-containing protein [Terriglobia bacterium]
MRTLLTAMTAALGLVSAAALLGQDPLRLRVDVSLVTLDVEVTDSNGRPITNLSRDEFQIYENGALQQLGSFDSVDTPYNILLLFDCSGSTEGDWPFLIQAMNRFTQMLRPQDRVAVAQFGSGYKILQTWFTRPASAVAVSVRPRDSVCMGTDFYGAVQRGIEELQPVKTRKGAVVLTDGRHGTIPYRKPGGNSLNYSRYVDSVDDSDFQKLLRSVATSPAVLYFVAVDTDLNPDQETTGAGVIYNPDEIYNKQQVRSRLEELASLTGGRVVYPQKPEDVVPLYEQMARELGSVYSLGYAPSNSRKDETYRKIEVRVRDRSMHVRQSRDGYQAR